MHRNDFADGWLDGAQLWRQRVVVVEGVGVGVGVAGCPAAPKGKTLKRIKHPKDALAVANSLAYRNSALMIVSISN